jgi:hypothetical protein
VIFTEYRDTLNYLRKSLSDAYKISSIDGTMSIQERNSALERFKDPQGSEIMLCTDAAGEGIDMQFCNNEINYDLPWNPNKLEQRMGRIHRIGQDRKVYYYNFIITDTIDGYILDKLLKKMEIIKNSIGDKIYDIIGKLFSEEEFAILYEELLRLPKEKWEARIRKIDGIIEEKQRLFEEIERLLSGHRLNKSDLGHIQQNIQKAPGKDDIKRFLNRYSEFYKTKLELIDENEELYRLQIPKIIANKNNILPIIEGTFNGSIAIEKNYTYFSLGNPQIMSLITDAAKPTVNTLVGSERNGVLLVYKIEVKDGRNRERNGTMICFIISGNNVEEINLEDIWKFKTTSYNPSDYDLLLIKKSEDFTSEYVQKSASKLVAETILRLEKVSENTKDSIIRYYSAEIGKVQAKINDYIEKQDERPSYSKLIDREDEVIRKFKNELNLKIRETEKSFSVYPVTELVGIALLINPNETPLQEKLARPGFVPRLGSFSILNQRINSEKSETTHVRFTENPEEWIEYHRSYREARKDWKVIPYEEILNKVSTNSPRLRIGDFGCGEAKMMEVLGDKRVFSCDHVAINSKVTACDMRSVPLPDGSLDIVIFSLSLMGKNWIDYIKEAKRCLWMGGTLLIADTINSITEGRLSNIYRVLKDNDFEIIKEEQKDVFLFIEAIKKDNKL